MHDPYDLFDRRERQREGIDNPDLWSYRLRKLSRLEMFDRWADEACDNTISFTHAVAPKHDLDGYDAIRKLAQRIQKPDAA
jgi:hypothetical protein